MATPHYDLVILSSGSTAFVAAIRAGELGKRVVMTEVRTVGARASTGAACRRST